MAGLEPVGRGSQPPRRPGGEVERPGAAGGSGGPGGDGPPRFTGGTIEYGDWQYSPTEAWQFLSRSTREWAEEQAGDPIRDPHTGVPTVYWNCWVRPGPRGPRGGALTATYALVLFGKRGLAAGSGSTEQFVESPGATRWRNRRFAVPVDPAGVRHDHRTEAAPAPPTETAAPSAAPPVRPPSGDADLLPAHVARMYGHLPASTQAFQCEPFARRGARPAEADVFATIQDDGRERRETYWAYMFDTRWVTFAHARRAVPSDRARSRRRGRGKPPRADGFDLAEWQVAAWAAPVLRPGQALTPR